ncbi:hypothetical protein [Streptomyces thermocarboxydovorans]
MASDARRGRTGTAAAAAVASGAAAAGGLLAVTMPVHDFLPAAARLMLWLALAASAWGGAEIAVARLGPGAAGTRPGPAVTSCTGPRPSKARARHLRTHALLSATLFAELLLITARAARTGPVTVTATAGGLMLALVAAATWRVTSIAAVHGTGSAPSEDHRALWAFAVSVLCGSWLTIRSAAHGPLWAAWLLGSLLLLSAALFWLLDYSTSPAAEDYCFLLGVTLAAAGGLGAVTDAFVRGDIAVPTRAAVGVITALALLAAVTGAARGLRGRAADTGPPGAQLAGLIVPLGTTGWAAWESRTWDSAQAVLAGVTGLAATAVLLLVLQAGVLKWLDTALPERDVARLVLAVRRAAQPVDHDRQRGYRERERGYRDREHGYREPAYWEGGEADWEPEALRREREVERQLGPHAALITFPGRGGAVRHLLAHPLLSPDLAAVHRDLALSTGLAVDTMWPRVDVVATPTVRQRVRRLERRVLIWRLIAAGALCTTAVWGAIACATAGYLWPTDAVPDPALFASVAAAGPVLPAGFAITQARRRLVESTRAKAQAIDILRFPLARTMQLELPENTDRMILLAPALSGDRLPGFPPAPLLREGAPHEPDLGQPSAAHPRTAADPTRPAAPRPGHWPPTPPLSPTAADPTDLGRLRRDIREEVWAAVHSAMRDAYGPPAPHAPTRITLGEEHLSRLARDIARSTAEPVGDRLKNQFAQLRQSLQQEMGAAIRTSLEDTVTGPPLTNFVGYLAIEPDRRADSDEPPLRAEHGTLKATAGGRISLMLSVVRDRRAQNTAGLVAADAGQEFFVYQPIRVEGGREATSVQFDAMVDSSTLTPLPQRKSLSVAHEVQTPFGFRLPGQPGIHEVWFQLYQAGRLIQVAALKIEVQAAPDIPAAGEPDETPRTSGTEGEDATDA